MSALYRPPPSNSTWLTPGLTERACRLHAEGRRPPQIAALLNAEFGLSFSADSVARKLRRVAADEGQPEVSGLTISLPSAAGRYAFRAGRLLFDGAHPHD